MMANFYSIFIHPKEGVQIEDIEKEMNNALSWFRQGEKYWIVHTTSDAKQWYSRLEKFVDPGGRVIIIKLDLSDYWGYSDKTLWDWIQQRRTAYQVTAPYHAPR